MVVAAQTSMADTDIAILGAGPVGLSLALALREGPWRITVFDAEARFDPAADPRALALSDGSRQLLQRIGAWPRSTAIRNIDISHQGGHAATGLYANSLGIDALGHVVRYGDLVRELRDRVDNAPTITLLSNHRAQCVAPSEEGLATIRFGNKQSISAGLVVHAEGAHDENNWRLDYAQTALICEATPTLPHHHLAYERFTPEGPLALLPLEQRYAVVRVIPSAQCESLLALTDPEFARHLATALGHRVTFSDIGPRQAFPLALKIRRAMHERNEVWIGNAAQSLHPVSGQGFNLGLRDTWTLAETLLKTHGHLQKKGGNATFGTLPPAFSPATLATWARARQPDRLATAAFTDGIVRLFSNDAAPLRHARDMGLRALDTFPALRNFVARRMIWGARGG